MPTLYAIDSGNTYFYDASGTTTGSAKLLFTAGATFDVTVVGNKAVYLYFTNLGYAISDDAIIKENGIQINDTTLSWSEFYSSSKLLVRKIVPAYRSIRNPVGDIEEDRQSNAGKELTYLAVDDSTTFGAMYKTDLIETEDFVEESYVLYLNKLHDFGYSLTKPVLETFYTNDIYAFSGENPYPLIHDTLNPGDGTLITDFVHSKDSDDSNTPSNLEWDGFNLRYRHYNTSMRNYLYPAPTSEDISGYHYYKVMPNELDGFTEPMYSSSNYGLPANDPYTNKYSVLDAVLQKKLNDAPLMHLTDSNFCYIKAENINEWLDNSNYTTLIALIQHASQNSLDDPDSGLSYGDASLELAEYLNDPMIGLFGVLYTEYITDPSEHTRPLDFVLRFNGFCESAGISELKLTFENPINSNTNCWVRQDNTPGIYSAYLDEATDTITYSIGNSNLLRSLRED